MINYFSDVITNFFMENKIISEEDKAIYKYGTEVSISTIIGIFFVLLIGGIFSNILDSILFLLCFITVRVFTGGYHANSYIKCNLTFIIVFITAEFLSKIIPQHFEFLLGASLLVISLFIIAILSPVENKYKPLYGNEKVKYKKISVIMSFLLSVCAVILFWIGFDILRVISVTMFLIATLMVVEKIK